MHPSGRQESFSLTLNRIFIVLSALIGCFLISLETLSFLPRKISAPALSHKTTGGCFSFSPPPSWGAQEGKDKHCNPEVSYMQDDTGYSILFPIIPNNLLCLAL